MSSLLWVLLVLTVVLISVLTQVLNVGSATALAVGVVDTSTRSLERSTNYAGGEWSIESSRLSPPSAEGVTTLIVEVQVRNRLVASDYTMHRKSLWLVADWGERVALDRFANNESSSLVHVDTSETKSLTLAFKTSHTNFDFDDWQIEIFESEFHKPAVLPLTGDLNAGTIDLGFEDVPSESIYEPERVVVSSNHGSRRALNGRTFLHMEISVNRNDFVTQMERLSSWSLQTNLETSEALRVSYVDDGQSRTFHIVFDVDVAATTAELEISTDQAEATSFSIVANKLG